MSRTWKHRPWRVQENDPRPATRFMLTCDGGRHLQRTGWDATTRTWKIHILHPCDIDQGRDTPGPRLDVRCYRRQLKPACGCRWHNGHYENREQRRRDRHNARHDLHTRTHDHW